MGVGGLYVHRSTARSALFLAMRPGRGTMATVLARALCGTPLLMLAGVGLLTLLGRLTLLPLALILLGALLARSTTSTTPSAASPPGISGGTVRSTIHIVVTLLLCVTWTFLPGRTSGGVRHREPRNCSYGASRLQISSVCNYLRFYNLASGLRCSQSIAPGGYCMVSVCQFRRKLKPRDFFHRFDSVRRSELVLPSHRLSYATWQPSQMRHYLRCRAPWGVGYKTGRTKKYSPGERC
jgi:hypothetical protein